MGTVIHVDIKKDINDEVDEWIKQLEQLLNDLVIKPLSYPAFPIITKSNILDTYK